MTGRILREELTSHCPLDSFVLASNLLRSRWALVAVARRFDQSSNDVIGSQFAAFQLFDGIQTAATGALRGAGNTRTPMFCHFTAYWIIGLPLGAWLTFRRNMGALGLWVGLSLALILIGIVLLIVWRNTARKFVETLR